MFFKKFKRIISLIPHIASIIIVSVCILMTMETLLKKYITHDYIEAIIRTPIVSSTMLYVFLKVYSITTRRKIYLSNETIKKNQSIKK
jgi:hypothetical protein